MKGKVVRSTGSWYEILTDNGKIINARLRGKFRQQDLKVTNPVAVGDLVNIKPEEKNEKAFIIDEIEERDNYIIRKSPKKEAHAHIIASNIDQAFIIVTLVSPRTSSGFIDRFLVSCEAYHITPSIIFNKQDILTTKEQRKQDQWIEIYENLGYQCIKTTFTGDDPSLLMKNLEAKTTLLSGHSGVGKSTLLNKLNKDINQKTSEISGFANKGVHTTTFAEMFILNNNTFVIDTPGIKELGLYDMEPSEISLYFPEMRTIREDCRFYNCLHINEPGCRVKEAATKGDISPMRYKNYRSMIENTDNRR
mgnify:CR=1 FL=1